MALPQSVILAGDTFLEQLEQLGNEELAAAVAGLSPDLLNALSREFPDFAQERIKARARFEADMVTSVATAARRGDSRSAQWILERTNKKYAPPERTTNLRVNREVEAMSDDELLAIVAGENDALPADCDTVEHGQTEETEPEYEPPA